MFELSTVTAHIAGLTISGVNVKDIDDLADSYTVRDCPVMFPFSWSDGTITRDSQGPGSAGLKTLVYRITYLYLHQPVGATRFLSGAMPGIAANLAAIYTALETNDAPGSATVDMRLIGFSPVGEYADPAGNQYLGCELTLEIMEYVN